MPRKNNEQQDITDKQQTQDEAGDGPHQRINVSVDLPADMRGQHGVGDFTALYKRDDDADGRHDAPCNPVAVNAAGGNSCRFQPCVW